MMNIATQQQLDAFSLKQFFNEDIYPFLSTSKWVDPPKVDPENWNKIYFINTELTALLNIGFNRQKDEISIGLWCENASSAGVALRLIDRVIARYKPRAIASVVHESNTKSLALHRKVYGEPYGIEIKSAWNSLKGEWEDLYCFRKVL